MNSLIASVKWWLVALNGVYVLNIIASIRTVNAVQRFKRYYDEWPPLTEEESERLWPMVRNKIVGLKVFARAVHRYAVIEAEGKDFGPGVLYHAQKGLPLDRDELFYGPFWTSLRAQALERARAGLKVGSSKYLPRPYPDDNTCYEPAVSKSE